MPIENNRLYPPDPFVMNEDEVNMHVANYLKSKGFYDVKYLTGKSRGVDVHGKKDCIEVFVESKGSHANYHGKDIVLDNSHLWDHLCKQICKLIEYRDKYNDKKNGFILYIGLLSNINIHLQYILFLLKIFLAELLHSVFNPLHKNPFVLSKTSSLFLEIGDDPNNKGKLQLVFVYEGLFICTQLLQSKIFDALQSHFVL